MVTSSVLTSPKEQALTLGKLTPKSDLSQLEVSASSEHNIHQHGIECPTFGSSPLLTQADRALELHKLWQARAAVFFSQAMPGGGSGTKDPLGCYLQLTQNCQTKGTQKDEYIVVTGYDENGRLTKTSLAVVTATRFAELQAADTSQKSLVEIAQDCARIVLAGLTNATLGSITGSGAWKDSLGKRYRPKRDRGA